MTDVQLIDSIDWYSDDDECPKRKTALRVYALEAAIRGGFTGVSMFKAAKMIEKYLRG